MCRDPKRPFVRLCMAVSLDGRISQAADQGPRFTSRFDRNKLFALRAEADLLWVGAGTVRTEKLPPLIRDNSLTAKRLAAGLSEHPDVALISRSLDLPWGSAYFQEAKQRIWVLTPNPKRDFEVPSAVHFIDLPDATLTAALTALGERGYRNVLSEGGGRMVTALLAEDLIDEVALTIAPLFIGGEDTPLLTQGDFLNRGFSLAGLETHENEIHAVYKRGNE